MSKKVKLSLIVFGSIFTLILVGYFFISYKIKSENLLARSVAIEAIQVCLGQSETEIECKMKDKITLESPVPEDTDALGNQYTFLFKASPKGLIHVDVLVRHRLWIMPLFNEKSDMLVRSVEVVE